MAQADIYQGVCMWGGLRGEKGDGKKLTKELIHILET